MCMPLTLFSSRISLLWLKECTLLLHFFSMFQGNMLPYPPSPPPSTLNRWYPWHLTLCQQKDLRVLLLILPINHLKFLMESTCSSIVKLPVHLFVVFVIFFYVRHSGRKAVSQIFQVSIIQFLKNVSFFPVWFSREGAVYHSERKQKQEICIHWYQRVWQWGELITSCSDMLKISVNLITFLDYC